MEQTERPSNVTTIQEREQQLRARSAARTQIAQLGGQFCGFVGVRRREIGGAQVFMVDEPMMELLDPRYDVENHSPDGYEWGYAGSGPSQLALAICCNVVGRDRAQRIYHEFKQQFVAKLTVDQWYLRREDAMRIIELIEAQLDAAKEAERDEVLARACPICGARPGNPCIQQRGEKRGEVRALPHPDRKIGPIADVDRKAVLS